MAVNFFRVSNDFALPKHWAYGEAWDLEETAVQVSEDACEVAIKLVDRRERGCQGWCDLAQAIAATVWHQDGDYGPRDYAFLLLIESLDARTTSYWWDECRTAKRLWSVELAAIHRWLHGIPECCEDGKLDAERVHDWIEKSEGKARKRLKTLAVERPVEYVETLPCPKKLRKYLAK